MIIRRFVTALRQQDWAIVTIEFLIVVAGIFVGLQVDDWNSHRENRSLEKQYIALLSRDLVEIEKSLAAQIAHEAAIVQASRSALSRVNAPVTQRDTASLAVDLTQMWGRVTLTVDSPAFTELKSSGRLTVLSDSGFRNRLIGLFDSLARAQAVTEKNNDFFAETYSQFMRHSGIGFETSENTACEGNQSTTCRWAKSMRSLFPGEKTGSWDLALTDSTDDQIWAQLRAHVVSRGLGADGTARVCQSVLNETQSLIAQMDGF